MLPKLQITLLLTLQAVYGQTQSYRIFVPDDPPNLAGCYDDICETTYGNVAREAEIDATNTCGLRTLNDTSTEDLIDFQTFHTITDNGEILAGTCSMNSINQTDHHPIELIQDFETHWNRSWWQSITLYESDMLHQHLQSNITLDFRKTYELTQIEVQFQSYWPGRMEIYKKTYDSSDWQPYQYFSDDCQRDYGFNANTLPSHELDVMCTSKYSQQITYPPLGTSLVFTPLNNRWQDADENKLKEWTTASAIQIRLLSLNASTLTENAWTVRNKTEMQSYYYAISDVRISGRCICNGHARFCERTTSENGNWSVKCLCQQGVIPNSLVPA